MKIPTRRFGRTDLAMPVLSLGGMRFQQSWSDLPPAEIEAASQENLLAILERAVAAGIHHIETARAYGSSERQLGWLLGEVKDPQRILQTKVLPHSDPQQFEKQLALSVERLGIEARGERLDLLTLHGINNQELLEQTLRPGGCLAVAQRWQAAGRVGHIGFSTHAPLPVILEAIESDGFDYINLHWYFIRQDNSAALEAARANDLGVFVISPTDKGGHLHTPAPRFSDLCQPLHPIVFNDLFCLSQPAIHTLSVGAARCSDLDLHLEAVARLAQAQQLLLPILAQLEAARLEALEPRWLASWQQGLPDWQATPGGINLPVLLWLHNLLEAWGLEDYCRARYGLLGAGGHWFPGENADGFDSLVNEQELRAVLASSPWSEQIPDLLRNLRGRLGGQPQQRLSAG